MKWYHPSERLPETMCPLILDCTEGVGEGYYFGREMFRFVRFGLDVNADDVYRWAFMPQHDEHFFFDR